MKVVLNCEYMSSPRGLDIEHPRFSFYSDDALRNVKQIAYRLIVDNTLGKTVFDSGVVKSSESSGIEYGGDLLETAEKYYAVVQVYYDNGEKSESDPLYFTMGLMGKDKNWNAPFIGNHHIGKYTYWYRKEFTPKKEIENAAVFVLSGCYYVLSVNGKKADDTVLNNVTSDYEKTMFYGTYDITDKIIAGEANAVGVSVGMGWQNLRLSEDGVGWEENSFSAEIYLKYKDGSNEWIYSDLNGWYYTFEGPVLYNGIYGGEIYDARREITGFDTPGYKMDKNWFTVVEHESPGGKIKSQCLEPIKIVKELAPKEIFRNADGSCTVNFGQNFAGWMRLKVHGKRGNKIELRYAEIVNEDHSVNTITLRKAQATDIYYPKGEETEIYEPSFTFHGFQYVQIFGLTEEPKAEMFTGCVVRSVVDRIGDFESSNEILNKLYSNIIWTECSNLYGVPTDCPQRDERLGWLNDMAVRNEGAIYNYRLTALYEKWMGDIRDTQGKNTGAITDTAPFRRYGSRPADPVSSSFLLVPWNIYVHYKDKKIIEENYEAAKRWVKYLIRNSDDFIMRYSQMGDWAGPIGGNDTESSGGGAISAITPTTLMGTGFLYYNCTLLSKMAKVIGKKEEEKIYLELAKNVSESFIKNFYNENSGNFATGSQASNTFPMYLDIVPEDKKAHILKCITDDIKNRGGHLTTGNLCSRYIIEVLLRNGEADLAYDVLTTTEYPGWGYMIVNGATTVWERWEKVVEDGKLAEMASYNHPMNGAVGVCFPKHFAGILADENNPAFESFTIKPVVPSKLEAVSFKYHSVKGTIKSAWKQKKSGIELSVTIPVNTSADVYVPVIDKSEIVSVMLDGEEIYNNGYKNKLFMPKEVSQDSGYVRFAVTSGEYTFSLNCK